MNNFVDRLIDEKKFENLSAEVIEQIKSDLLDRVEDQIDLAILENLPPEKMDEFNELLDGNDLENIQTFCRNNISDLDNLIAETLMMFRDNYLNS